MATQEQIEKVARLKAVYEKLVSGASAVEMVDSTGEKVVWKPGSELNLKKLIRELELEYGLVKLRSMNPVGVIF